jgi:hypothetical protein
MAAFSTRGLKTYLLHKDVTVAADPITLTVGKPASIAPAPAEGSIVKVTGTGLGSIDNRVFKVGATGQLLGSNTTHETASPTAGSAYEYSPSTDFAGFCINSLARDVPAGDTISTATFCNPDAQVAGAPAGAGTLTWGGPIDFCDAGFQEMQDWLDYGGEAIFYVEFPNDAGSMSIPIEINSYSESFELNAAGTWTGGAVVKAKPSYAPNCP